MDVKGVEGRMNDPEFQEAMEKKARELVDKEIRTRNPLWQYSTTQLKEELRRRKKR